MKDDDQQRTLIQRVADSALRTVASAFRVTTTRTCRDCGEKVIWSDNSQCGEHLPVPEETYQVHINFVPALKPEQELPPPEPEQPSRKKLNPKYSERFKNTDPDPLAKVETPRRTDGGMQRDTYHMLHGPDEFQRRAISRIPDYEPKAKTEDADWDFTPDVPTYGFDER